MIAWRPECGAPSFRGEVNPGKRQHRQVVDSCFRPKKSLRSEEHPSELQSLMRISYAVFCLKKKIDRMPMPTSLRRLGILHPTCENTRRDCYSHLFCISATTILCQ